MQRSIFIRRNGKVIILACMVSLAITLAGCGSGSEVQQSEEVSESIVTEITDTVQSNPGSVEDTKAMKMLIGDTEVAVEWEDNETVDALKELAASGDLTINMSMYGGFEQAGSIGSSLPRNDVQTTTAAGDIVLYSGNQIVVFYGSNSWSYTRLGKITDMTAEEITSLLGNGDVTLRIQIE